MAPKLVLACLAVSMGDALRRHSKKKQEPALQRGDDVLVMAQDAMTSNSSSPTVAGCECKDNCRLSYTHNCNAAMYCTVSRECPGAKGSLLHGTYDYCQYLDGAVRGLSAAQRFASLLQNMQRDDTPQPYFGSIDVALGVRGESMVDTMTMEHDVFYYPRKKYVRPVGVVAPVKFVSNGKHPYTGIFKGNDLGIVRLSLSLEPNDKNGFAPGVALKFLREDRPSANFMGFTSFTGQNCSDKNFFRYNMYTNVPPATGLSTLVPKKFKQATSCTQMVGLSDAADDFNGQTPNFPFDIVFKGLQSVDFSCGDKGAAGWANLGKLQKGTRLFELLATPKPKATPVPIGHIVLAKSLTTSKFGDEQLFFRHQRMEEDFQIHPEWLNDIDSQQDCGTTRAGTVPPDPDDGCYNIL